MRENVFSIFGCQNKQIRGMKIKTVQFPAKSKNFVKGNFLVEACKNKNLQTFMFSDKYVHEEKCIQHFWMLEKTNLWKKKSYLCSFQQTRKIFKKFIFWLRLDKKIFKHSVFFIKVRT